MKSMWNDEIRNGQRFEFGANWAYYLKNLDETKIAEARHALLTMLQTDNLEGKTFLDIGSGSGIHSLVARMVGAKVLSFDYDINSVHCTQFLKDTYFPNDPNWTIENGSILDLDYITRIGKFDIVYSWGVLHHTGHMFEALKNAIIPVSDNNGKLFIAIYNTQITTPIWKKIKQFYVSLPKFFQIILNQFFLIYFATTLLIADMLRLRNPFKRYFGQTRGMAFHTDVIDWIGGYPFETAKPEEIFEFYRLHGFDLERLVTVGGKMGCNEFVFIRKTLEKEST